MNKKQITYKAKVTHYNIALCNILPCLECGEKPHLIDGYGYTLRCRNDCGKKYENDEDVAAWFQTFPWSNIDDAVKEWNDAVKCGHSVRQRKLF